MNQPTPTYTREQLIAFLAAWMKTHPGLTLAAAREEGRVRGFTVGRREYEEARTLGTGSPLHPEHGGVVDAASAARGAAAVREAAAARVAAEHAERRALDDAADALDAGAASPDRFPVRERADADEADDADETTAGASAPRAVAPRREPVGLASTDVDRDFWIDYLRRRPDASFREVNEAAVAAGRRKATPIGFGLARKAAGIGKAAVRLRPTNLGRRDPAADAFDAADDAPVVAEAPARPSTPRRAARTRRESDAPVAFDGAALDDVRRLMADYERLREALLEIARIVRSARAD